MVVRLLRNYLAEVFPTSHARKGTIQVAIDLILRLRLRLLQLLLLCRPRLGCRLFLGGARRLDRRCCRIGARRLPHARVGSLHFLEQQGQRLWNARGDLEVDHLGRVGAARSGLAERRGVK